MIMISKKELLSTSEKLSNEADSASKTIPPSKKGSGKTVDKLDDMVKNMDALHSKVVELLSSCSAMLKTMGYEFEQMDKLLADYLNKIE